MAVKWVRINETWYEFIRRFLIHVLPQGFHRIRHFGLFANGARAANLARARELLCVPTPQRKPDDVNADEPPMLSYPCPSRGGPMSIIETFEPGHAPRAPPPRKTEESVTITAAEKRQACRHPSPATAPLGSSPPRAASSTSKTRRRHPKAVATPCPPLWRPARSSRSSRPRKPRKPPWPQPNPHKANRPHRRA